MGRGNRDDGVGWGEGREGGRGEGRRGAGGGMRFKQAALIRGKTKETNGTDSYLEESHLALITKSTFTKLNV